MGGEDTVKKAYYLLVSGLVFTLLFGVTPIYAQLEDELLTQEAEVECEPESLLTVYEKKNANPM